MTCLNEDDIIQRALIALLTPDSFASESNASISIRKEKFRESGRTATMTFESVVAEPVSARISIVEQLTPLSLSVCWSDPQSGHYTDQVWWKGVARRPSICVLTGRRIHPGDSVFQPRVRERYVPANRDRMILAAVVHEDSILVR